MTVEPAVGHHVRGLLVSCPGVVDGHRADDRLVLVPPQVAEALCDLGEVPGEVVAVGGVDRDGPRPATPRCRGPSETSRALPSPAWPTAGSHPGPGTTGPGPRGAACPWAGRRRAPGGWWPSGARRRGAARFGGTAHGQAVVTLGQAVLGLGVGRIGPRQGLVQREGAAVVLLGRRAIAELEVDLGGLQVNGRQGGPAGRGRGRAGRGNLRRSSGPTRASRGAACWSPGTLSNWLSLTWVKYWSTTARARWKFSSARLRSTWVSARRPRHRAALLGLLAQRRLMASRVALGQPRHRARSSAVSRCRSASVAIRPATSSEATVASTSTAVSTPPSTATPGFRRAQRAYALDGRSPAAPGSARRPGTAAGPRPARRPSGSGAAGPCRSP